MYDTHWCAHKHTLDIAENMFTPQTPLAPQAQIFRLKFSDSFLWIELIGWCMNWNFTGMRLLYSTVKLRGGLYALTNVQCWCRRVHVSNFISILSVQPYESVVSPFSSPFPPSAHHPNSTSHSVLLLSCTLPFLCKGPECALWAAINKERCGESY